LEWARRRTSAEQTPPLNESADGEVSCTAEGLRDDPEPPDLSLPLHRDPRVIVTPYAAFYNEKSVAELRQRAARQVGVRLAGGVPEHVVNSVVLTR
jgi:hypothetical protein